MIPYAAPGEPLTESVSTKVGTTTKKRLLDECKRLGVTQAAYTRAALEAKLDTSGG